MLLDLSREFDIKRAKDYFDKLITDQSKIEIKKVRKTRSLDQNRYFHLCVKFFCAETGYTIKEAKTLLAREFGSFMIYETNGNKFIRSTSDLNTQEMTQYIDWIRNVACYENLGVYVMTPDEYITHQFDIDKEFQHVI